MANQIADRTGMRYGRLTVLSFTGKLTKSGHNAIWLCQCDCGNLIERNSGALTYKGIQSCGCFVRERMGQLNKTHGGRHDKLYLVWMDMRRCCRDKKDKNYCNYGGRGIGVCEEWENYANFRDWAYSTGYNANAKYHTCTLDRINVNGNYTPENCRWVDSRVQCNNRRSNHLVEYNGRTQTVAQWARELDIPYGRTEKRLVAGWAVEDAFFKPSRVANKISGG